MIEKPSIALKWWKDILTKNLWWLKWILKVLITLLNIGSMIILMLIVMLKR